MKVNEKFITIPPYLSVSWKEVASLYQEEETLMLELKSGTILKLPPLPKEQIDAIFLCHSHFLEQEGKFPLPIQGRVPFPFPLPFPPNQLSQLLPLEGLEGGSLMEFPIAFKIGTPDGIISAVSHNPALSKSPDLAQDLLDKFAGISKMMGSEEIEGLPRGVEGCNCFFCQIMNRLHHESALMKEDEAITEEDLKFKDWQILQTGEKMFSVENPLDSAEKFSVYLGHPVGCSCGKEGCEHIIAVLKS